MKRPKARRPGREASQTPPSVQSPSWIGLAGGVVIGLAVLLAFWPSLSGGFLWDDDNWIAAVPSTLTHRLIHDDGGLRGETCRSRGRARTVAVRPPQVRHKHDCGREEREAGIVSAARRAGTTVAQKQQQRQRQRRQRLLQQRLLQ